MGWFSGASLGAALGARAWGMVLLGAAGSACGGSQPDSETPASAEQRQAEADAEAEANYVSLSPEEAAPDVVAESQLGTDAVAVRPGKSFLLFLTLDPASGYRLHWENPGDIGGPIEASFKGPEGFEVSEALYPTPTRFAIDGGLVAYGYEEKTAVFAKVTAPKKLDMSGTYRFEVKAKWLACKRECIKEETNAFFELVASYSGAKAELESDVAALYARVPTPLSDVEGIETKWSKRRGASVLTVSAPDAQFEAFYPLSHESWKFKKAVPGKQGLALSFERPKRHPHPVRGVVVGTVNGEAGYFQLHRDWSTGGKL